APALLGMVHEPAERRCVLLLEDLEARYTLADDPLRRGRLGRAVDELVRLHAHWWQHPRIYAADLSIPQNGFSRLAQALPERQIRGNARQAREAIAAFTHRFAAELGADELRLLHDLPEAWGERFAGRVANGRHLTLCHGDFHLFGNVLFPREPADGARPRFVDWNQHRRGLGAHDLAYCLVCHDVEPARRLERDTALLRRYHRGLRRGGVAGYSLEQCEWDFRFSVLANLFLAFFVCRLGWFTKAMAAVRVWDAGRTLEG
ncbi:MAG TPA: phosphotransferase, partial [Longimicrobiaceae bacterium]|nr:phosphotransferase [Longimicrobiaceae bacterium]